MADSEKNSYSDKLAIALTCGASVMAIALFLVEKTPVSTVVLLVLMLALSIYPILDFSKSKTKRIICLIVALVGTVALGWAVWPKAKPLETATQSANSVKENNGTTDSIKVDVHHPIKDTVAVTVSHKKSQPLPKETARQDNSVHVDRGSKIEQQSSGDCSPNIVGGSNTVNCGPSPPPPLKISWNVSPNQSRDASEYVLMVTVTVNTPMSPVAVGVICDTPLTRMTIGTHRGVIAVNERTILDGAKAFVYYEGMPLAPSDELYLTLSAPKPFSVLAVGPAKIKGLND
jgi:hypothetical protein